MKKDGLLKLTLSEELAKYDQWVKSGLLLVFLYIRFNWDTRRTIHTITMYGCFSAKEIKLSICDRDRMVWKAYKFYSVALNWESWLILALINDINVLVRYYLEREREGGREIETSRTCCIFQYLSKITCQNSDSLCSNPSLHWLLWMGVPHRWVNPTW